MSNDLCWKCKEWLLTQGVNWVSFNDPHLHCHHEPKERPKCWCEKAHVNSIAGYPHQVGSHPLNTATFNFCPECGGKL